MSFQNTKLKDKSPYVKLISSPIYQQRKWVDQNLLFGSSLVGYCLNNSSDIKKVNVFKKYDEQQITKQLTQNETVKKSD